MSQPVKVTAADAVELRRIKARVDTMWGDGQRPQASWFRGGAAEESPWVLIKIASSSSPAVGKYYAYTVTIDVGAAISSSDALDATAFTTPPTYDLLACNLNEMGAAASALSGSISQVYFLAWKSGQRDEAGREVVYFDGYQSAACSL